VRVVVSDTSPIRYLVLIGEADLLERLYGRILIPHAVSVELQTQQTPEAVRTWMHAAPSWVEVNTAHQPRLEHLISSTLDSGEGAPISIALEMEADLMLMDERAGGEEARRLGIAVTGTLGVLARGAERGLVRMSSSLDKLLATKFRVRPEVVRQILLGDSNRR